MNSTSSKLDWSNILTGEILLFNLLGKLLYQYPDKAWFQALIRENVFEEIPFGAHQPDTQNGAQQIKQWVEKCQQNLSEDEMFERVESDFVRLFIGPGAALAAPWESVYVTDGRLIFQESTLQVRSWYNRFGLISEHVRSEPDDHIGLELVFMAHLANLALSALDKQDSAAFNNALDAQRDFGKEHLFVWAPFFSVQLFENAKTDFYKGGALILRGTLKEFVHVLELRSSEVNLT
jgi:TorA maturation chaperone TorD